MAHEANDKREVLVDWTTGDPEGDRAYLFRAYRAFLKELKDYLFVTEDWEALEIFDKWKIGDLDVDDFPRISIDYPEGYPENLK